MMTMEGHCQDRFELTFGTALLTYPKKMTPEDFEFFKEWMAIELNKLARYSSRNAALSTPTTEVPK